jgi:hypothetical protein
MTTKNIFSFIATLHLLTIVSCRQPTTNLDKQLTQQDSFVTKTNLDIIVCQLAIPPRDTFDLFPEITIAIKKDSIKPTFLKFQPGGTETNITIIDSVYSTNFKNIWDCPVSKQLDFLHNESGLLDISDLQKGTYFIRYSSCSRGGNYKLVLTN